MTFMGGTRLGPYEILGLLGAGGMGEVYRARDPRLGRDVAIKVLPAEVGADPERLSRFEREARAVAALSHPNILTVFDVGTREGLPYVVTELLEGETLRELVARRAPTQRQVLFFLSQAAHGLEAAHAKGIVHRDVKPENLFVTTDGRVKLLDFGLAKQLERLASGSGEATESSPTGAGQVLGTVAYMSPEQVRGLPVDHRTDIFSFGVLAYELLSGKHPFRRETTVGTLTAILEETPAELTTLGRGVPTALSGMVQRCLAKSRDERFRSAHDLALSLESVLAAPAGAASLDEVEIQSPYPGLSSFAEKDAALFFGREAEVQALWPRLRARHLSGVIGPSGAGKTSFVRAGVVASRPEGWGTLVCTPGAAPFRGLGQALAPELSGNPDALRKLLAFDDPETAFELVSGWRKGHGEALLVVDQFEELFTLNPPEAQQRFAALLGRLAREADVHVLLSLRDDFLMRCADHEPLARVFESLSPLPALSAEGLRRALEEPAKKRGYRFEDEGLVGEMVEAVEGARSALPLLAFAVARLWEKRDREKKVLTRAAYEEIGGVAGALAQHAEATMDRIGTERQAVVREIFRNLVTSQGTRAVAEREELLSVFPDRRSAEAVLRELVDARLLTSFEVEGKEGEPSRHRVEIAHESLLKAWPRLVRWQMQDEEGAVLRDQLKQAAHLWEEKGRPADLLWTGTSFREFELWRERYEAPLTASEEQFTRAMVARSERQRRRRRLAGAGVTVALSLVLATVSVLWQRAVREGRRAEAARVLALGRVELDRYPTAAVAYARRSLEIADSPAARAFAVEALWRGPTARILPVPTGGALTASWSPDGRWLAAYTFSENVQVFGEDGGPARAIGGFTTATTVAKVFFSAKSDALVTQVPMEPGRRLVSFPEGKEIRRLGPELFGGSTYGEWTPHPDGILVWPAGSSWFPNKPAHDAPGTWRLWPWDGGPLRELGVARGDRIFAVDGEHRWLALTRGDKVYLRPVEGSLDTPLREVASFKPSANFPLLSMSPSGNRLVVIDEADHVTVWPLGPGAATRPRRLELDYFGGGDFNLSWDDAGSRLVGQEPRTKALTVWDLDGPPDAGPLVFRRPDTQTHGIARLHPRGDWLTDVSGDFAALWAVSQPRVRVLSGPPHIVSQVAFAPDAKWLLSCANYSVRRLPLDAATGEGTLMPQPCFGLAASPDGSQELRAGFGVRLVPLQGGADRWLVPPKFPADALHSAVAFDRAGRRVAAATGFSRPPARKLLQVWDLPEATLAHEWPLVPPGAQETPAGWGVDRIAFAADGRLLAAGPGGIRRFDVDSGQSEWLWRLDDDTAALLAVTAAGRRFAAAASDPGVGTGARPGLRASRPGARGGGAAPSRWPGVFLFDLAGGPPRQVRSHGSRVSSLALDLAGRVLVTGDETGIVRVGTIEGGEPHLLIGHDGRVTTVAVSPDGKWVASAAESEIRLWPMPDLAKPPLHALPYDELMAKLRALTNLQVVEDKAAATGYRLEIGPFPGWKDVPTW
jgi:eukaryotic-like serine/threonine-protein kinase